MDLINQYFKEYVIPEKKYVIDLSGGVDSAVLALLVSKQTNNVRSIFVNHNQVDSNNLEKAAEAVANCLNLQHINISSDLEINASETKMREERYRVLFENISGNETLLFGHHGDDKIETFFINLLRGTRLKGLSSIPSESNNLERPLLNFSKKEIILLAQEYELPYLDDATNNDNKILRNWLRNDLVPQIKDKFDGDLNKRISRIINEINYIKTTSGDFEKYIKVAPGYIEVPITFLNKNNPTTDYLLTQISYLFGNTGLEQKDFEKIFSVIENKNNLDFDSGWNISTQAGLLLFINTSTWKISNELFSSIGYFNFQKIEKDKNFNNWSIELPTNLRNKLKFNQIEPGDSILIDGIDQKASEVFRSFGVNEVLRKVWPVLKLDDKIIWIPGIRKSDDVNRFDSHIESFIINTSREKSCFENI
jgi:tRNA(Ile)-lysidine synthase